MTLDEKAQTHLLAQIFHVQKAAAVGTRSRMPKSRFSNETASRIIPDTVQSVMRSCRALLCNLYSNN